jgi:hypothetical protein
MLRFRALRKKLIIEKNHLYIFSYGFLLLFSSYKNMIPRKRAASPISSECAAAGCTSPPCPCGTGAPVFDLAGVRARQGRRSDYSFRRNVGHDGR